MIKVNGVDMPKRDQDGLLVIVDEDGVQHWAMLQHAHVDYVEREFQVTEDFQLEVTATLALGQTLTMASEQEADEENVLVYSRLLVALLREERDRYAELAEQLRISQAGKRLVDEELAETRRDRDEMLHAAWRDGAATGWRQQNLPPQEMLAMNPHPLPEEEEEEESW